METLIVIGLGLALVTTMLVIVDHMAEDRGRHQGAWTMAALAGICAAVVGWFVVVGALILAGPTAAQRAAAHPKAAHAPKPIRP